MKDFITDMKFQLVDKLGINYIKRTYNATNNDVAVLMYHGVSEDNLNIVKNDWCQLKESEFVKQMEFLSEHYDVIPLMNMDKPALTNKPRVVITFDDGYANNYGVALKHLNKYNFPATIFLTSRLISKPKKYFMYWYDVVNAAMTLKGNTAKEIDVFVDDMKMKYTREQCYGIARTMLADLKLNYNKLREIYKAYSVLSVEQICKMRTKNITFGSHTVDHALLTIVPSAEAKEQIVKSHNILKVLENYIPVFCYPNGWRNETIVNEVSKVYEVGILAEGGLYRKERDDIHEIPRIGIGRDTNMTKFRGLLACYK